MLEMIREVALSISCIIFNLQYSFLHATTRYFYTREKYLVCWTMLSIISEEARESRFSAVNNRISKEAYSLRQICEFWYSSLPNSNLSRNRTLLLK